LRFEVIVPNNVWDTWLCQENRVKKAILQEEETKMTANAAVFTGVHKYFGEHHALKGLDLLIPTGSIYGFLGPNGAGKTTTLRLLMGIYRCDQGRVEVLGAEDPSQVRSRLGYLPEERGLYRKMRAAEAAEYFARLKGMSAQTARRRVTELLERFGLEKAANQRCETLSKGMGQKLQLLVTIVHAPELVVLDEPFSGLDPVNRDLMRDVVLELRQAGKTVLFSTHMMEQAERLCDRVLLIDHGRKILDGPVEQVRRQGGRTVELEYLGDGVDLHSLPGVEGLVESGRAVELHLADGTDPQHILAALVGRVEIRRFVVRAPSLHQVFIQAVGGNSDAA
jgi:ABC-2 type transport system ATP-binding protein